jgi:inner membrane transporter RhtA
MKVAYWLALGAMVTLQTGNALGIALIGHVGVPSAIFLRLFFGSLFLVAALRPRFRLRSKFELRLVLVYGVIVAVMGGSIYAAVDRLPLGAAVTVSMLGPLTVATISSRRRADLVWPALALVGVALMAESSVAGGPSIDPLGLVFAGTNAAAWGAYIIVAARTGRHFDGVQGLALACVVAALLWAPAGIASGGLGHLTWPLLGLAILTAIVATGLPYMFENIALQRMPPRLFGTLASLEPAIATLIGIGLGQELGVLAFVGIALVTIASIGASFPLGPNPVSAA